MITLILFIIAAFCKSIMDTIVHHWQKSIFSKLPAKWYNFFYAAESWKNKYINRDFRQGHKKLFGIINFPDSISDGWHLAQTIMLFCFIFGAVFYHPILNWYYDIAIIGVAFNAIFLLFYTKFWIKK